MLSGDSFQVVLLKFLEDADKEIRSPVVRIFEDADVRQAILQGDALAFEEAFFRAVTLWLPRDKLAVIVGTKIFEEVAMEKYRELRDGQLKNSLEGKDGSDPS